MYENNLKRVSQSNKKTSWNQVLQQGSHQRDKPQGCPPNKILGTTLEMDQGRTPTNGPEDKKTNDKV